MGKENFTGRLVLKRFFGELLDKILDDGKESRTFLQFKKQKDSSPSYPRIILFHGDYGQGKTTALNHCIEMARNLCAESKKSLNIINIDWEEWYYQKWSLPSNNIELMQALHEIFSGKKTGISSYFARFEELHSRVKKISSRVDEIIRNEWKRDPQDLTALEIPEQEQIKSWLQKKIPKQDLDIFEKSETRLAEILISGLTEACNEAPVLLAMDNYEYLQEDVEKWFRAEFLNRLTDLRMITVISGVGNFSKSYRNVFPEELLYIVNFSDITLTKLDILHLAAKNHLSVTESDAEKIERVTGGIPLVVQDLFSYALKGIGFSELLGDDNEAENFTSGQFASDMAARFLKYCTDADIRNRVFHLAMTRHFDPALFAGLWQVKINEAGAIIKKLTDQFTFIDNKGIHSLVRSNLVSYLQQELSNRQSSSLAPLFDHYAAVCAGYYEDQLSQLQKTILSSGILYAEGKYCNALIGYYCSLLWANPDAVFDSLPGTFIELIHFNVNFLTQLFWHISGFRTVLSGDHADCLDTLYGGIILADQSLVSSRVPVEPGEKSVMDLLETKTGQMTDLQQALFFHKKGELLIRQDDISGAKTLFDSSYSLMGSSSPREILYEDYLLLAGGFSLSGQHQQAIESLKTAVSIGSENYLPWFDLGASYLKTDDYHNAIEAFCRSTALNPDYQESWYYLGICYASIDKHEQAVASFVNAIEKGPENSGICYNMGLSLEKTGKHSDAVKTFRKVVEMDPQNVDSWYRIGRLSSILEHSDDAVSALQNAIAIDPDLTDAHSALGYEYSKTGRHKNAAESFEKAAGLNESDSDLWNQVASAWFSAEQNQKAIDAARKSISLKPDSSESWVIIGHAWTALGNFAEANTAYLKASEISPDDASVWVNLGNNYYAQSMYEEAIGSFKKAVNLDPSKEGTWFNLGLAYRVKEQYDEALEAFENAINQEPSNPECWFQKGRTHMTLSQFEDAAVSFSKTVELSPASHDAWYKRGLAFAKCAKHPEAIESFVKAAELWNTDADIWFSLGLSYCAINDFAAAVKSYQQASSLAPSGQEIWYNLGHCFQMLGQYHEAIGAYGRSLELLPDHFLSNYNKGVCQYYLGNYTEARDLLNTAVELQADHSDSLLFLALTCHALQDYNEAISHYNKVTGIKPDSSDAWFNLALAYHALADYDKAIEIYSETVRRWPENGTAWYNMGLVFHARNDLDNAINAYRYATQIDAGSADMWYSLGAAYHAQEHYGEAIQAYRKVIKISADHIDAHLNLGLAYSVWGQHADAIESYNKVLKLKPDHLQALENLCISCFSVNQYDQAIEAGQKALKIDSKEIWISGYIITAGLLTGKVSKAHEFADKLITADSTGEEIVRTLYFLNQEMAKNPVLQGAQEIIMKLEGAQSDSLSVSVPEN